MIITVCDTEFNVPDDTDVKEFVIDILAGAGALAWLTKPDKHCVESARAN